MIKNYYLHLMDGKPAYYDKQDRCIYFMNKYHKLTNVLCTSLEQLRRQQKQSEKTRAALHIDSSSWDMDYQRIPMEVKYER